MKGYVRHVNNEKGYGFIEGDDGDYFFHITNTANKTLPEISSAVTFTPDKNEKGKLAKDVKVVEAKNNKFIAFDGVRIKASNIKNYGISSKQTGRDIYQRLYLEGEAKYKTKFTVFLFGERVQVKPLDEWYLIAKNTIKDIKDFATSSYVDKDGLRHFNRMTYKLIKQRDGRIIDGEHLIYLAHEDDFKSEPVYGDYLYVTTFQGDNYTFTDGKVGFNVHKKLSEIDSVML